MKDFLLFLSNNSNLMKLKTIVFFLLTLSFPCCSIKKETSEAQYSYKYKTPDLKKHLKSEFNFNKKDIKNFYNMVDIKRKGNLPFDVSNKNFYINIKRHSENKEKLTLNSNNYGLYTFHSGVYNYIFLRTADTIVYYNCINKHNYLPILSKSNNILENIKQNIINEIDSRCYNEDRTYWFNARMY